MSLSARALGPVKAGLAHVGATIRLADKLEQPSTGHEQAPTEPDRRQLAAPRCLVGKAAADPE
jgi:hypothetical protein